MMKNHLAAAIAAAVKAGEEILMIYNNPESDFSIEVKSDSSPLTIADRKSHEVICEMLSGSAIPILSEEGKVIPFSERSTWDMLWIVDPLDGTKEFIKRNDEFTVNIALVEQGIPVMGVIYVPVARLLYFGAKGVGSFKVVVEEHETLENIADKGQKLPLDIVHESFTVVASRSHTSPETESYIAKLKEEHGDVKLATSGSSLKICLVAEGSAHVYPRFAPTMEWDTAAGHAIAVYAGKNMYKSDMSGPLLYNKENLLNPSFIVQ